MGRIGDFWDRYFLPSVAYCCRNRYLAAIRHSFFEVMPFLLAVALCDAAGSILLDPQGLVLGNPGLNLGFWLTGGMTGEDYRNTSMVQTLHFCRMVIGLGYGMTSLMLAVSLAGHLSELWDADRRLSMFCALAAFLMLAAVSEDFRAVHQDYFSDRRFFSAFFAAFSSAWLFAWLSGKERLRLHLPESFPREMARYMSSLLPVLLTLFAFVTFAMLLSVLRGAGSELVQGMGRMALFQEPLFAVFYQAAVWFLWWLGIPGYGFASEFQREVYAAAQAGNQLGETTAVFTSGFFEGGILHVMGLLLAVLIFSRHRAWRSAARTGFPFLLFNIQEPIMFGLPVILNPVFLIPYLLAPMANTLVGWAAISWGIVPLFHSSVTWTMPMFLNAALSTHSIMGCVLQAVWLVMDVMIYTPFVITANMVAFQGEEGEPS